jgi:Fructose-2,6-bisphosphatase
MRAYLIRHGATEANARRLYCGASDLPLTPEGAAELRRLRAAGGYPAAAGVRVYTSGLLRTEQTLALLFGPVPHTVLPALREMEFGAFEMRSYEELRARDDYQAWLSGDNEKNRCPGGESGEEMTARVTAEFSRLLARGEDFLAVFHGGPIAAVMARWFPRQGAGRYDWQPANGTGYWLDFNGDGRPLRYGKIPENNRMI